MTEDKILRLHSLHYAASLAPRSTTDVGSLLHDAKVLSDWLSKGDRAPLDTATDHYTECQGTHDGDQSP